MRAPLRELAAVPEGRPVGLLLRGRDRRPLQRGLARGHAGRPRRVRALRAVATDSLPQRPPAGLGARAIELEAELVRGSSHTRRCLNGLSRLLPGAVDQLDAVAVRILDEAEQRAALAHAVRLLLGLDALLLQLREGLLE